MRRRETPKEPPVTWSPRPPELADLAPANVSFGLCQPADQASNPSALDQSRAPAGPVNVCAAIELSKSRWVVAIQVPTSEKISVYKIAGGDLWSLLRLLDRTRGKLIAAGFDQVEVQSCCEIGYDGFWLHRLLECEGIHNHVLDSASIYLSRRGRHLKTDRLDAEALVRMLLALLRGERRVCSAVQRTDPS